MNYLLKISPVTQNELQVEERLNKILGPGQKVKAHTLVKKGGVVIKDLEEKAAENAASQLRNLGVQVAVLQVKDQKEEGEYQVKLAYGNRKVKEVAEATGLGLKESKELVDGLGVISSFGSRKEAELFAKMLSSLEVKVEIVSPEDPAPAAPEIADSSLSYQITGNVSSLRKIPLPSIRVRVFGRGLRNEQILGETRTDSKGNYNLKYSPGKLPDSKEKPELIIRAYDRSGKLLGQSGYSKIAGGKMKVDLVVS